MSRIETDSKVPVMRPAERLDQSRKARSERQMKRAKELLSAAEVADTFNIAEKFGTVIKCTDCNGTGSVCNNCGWPQIGCECHEPETTIGRFDPVVCEECGGTGEKK